MQSLLIPSSNSGKWVLSPDGSKLYVAGTDGNVRVYDSNDGSLLQTFEVGDYLNGIAISPDGTTLALSEGIPLPNNNVGFPRVYVVAEVYTLDLASGDVTSFVYESKYIQSYVFADVDFKTNDTIRIMQQSAADSPTFVPVVTIDLSTGEFTESGIYLTQDDLPANIISNIDGTFIVFGEAPGQYQYLVLNADGAEIAGLDKIEGPLIGRQGVEAYSGSSANDKIAIANAEGLFLFSSRFEFIADLSEDFPSLRGTPGIALSEDGAVLYAIDAAAGQVVAIGTDDLRELVRYDVGNLPFAVSPLNQELVISPDNRAFFINTAEGIYRIEKPLDYFGSSEDDVLDGTGENEKLFGLAGSDQISGSAGDDTLMGGTGADYLDGGEGNDTASYVDDDGSIFINLTLGRGYGNAAAGDTLTSIENVVGTGFDDFIIGDPGDNRLEGGGGADRIIGAIGADVLIGGEGADLLSFEDNSGVVFVNLLTGQGFNNAAQGDTFEGFENVIGGLFDDTLIGDDGANRLDGAMGADTLVGNGGADTFVFNYAPSGASGFDNPNSSANVDTIFDFVSGEDKLEIKASAFGGELSAGTLSESAFVVGTQAEDADDRFIYDDATGKLYFDADGSGDGEQVLVAIFPNLDAIAATDFLIVAL